MGTKYSTQSVSGYNATPPSDDGTVSEANKVKWSTIKTKLTDPPKTTIESIDSALLTHFNTGPTALTSNTTLGASHYGQFIQVSGSGVTLSLSDASSLGSGWYCWVRNTDSSNNVTIGRATGGDTFNGSAQNYTLRPSDAILVAVNAAANGFFTFNPALGLAHSVGGVTTFAAGTGAIVMSASSINEAKGSDIASDTTTDIGAATGNFVDVTGTTTITGLGTVQAGTRRIVRFTGALTLTHNGTSLILPGGRSILTAANDIAEFESLGSGNWVCCNYQRGAGVYDYVLVQDQKASGTDGGTFTQDAWQTRVINTEVSDTSGICSISSNQITLAAGVYDVIVKCPCYASVGSHQARLQNITDTATLLTGTTEQEESTSSMGSAWIFGRITLTAQKVIEVQHRCQATRANDGFGIAASLGTEVYTSAQFIRVIG